jgi:glycosyltransferase involved in cell wall biosynthesis
MNIAFYMPFKPLGHPHPSGDLVIGSELYDFLKEQGHCIKLVSRLRTRWLYWKPWMFLNTVAESARSISMARRIKADIWLTYHSYYKAPDILGPCCSRHLHIPYALFQGIYSTKRRRHIKSLPGFWINRWALKAAHAVFSNKKGDIINLSRIISSKRLHYIAPGIYTRDFAFDAKARTQMRSQWQASGIPVVMSAAMFRPGVKAKGLAMVIRTCGELIREGQRLLLVIAGDGSASNELKCLAKKHLSGHVMFLGQIDRNKIYQYFSAADIFAFPGIKESLGMVYLEAQACALPVVAFDNWGAKEAVVHGVTGLLSNANCRSKFKANLATLIKDRDLQQQMGDAARRHILVNHDIRRNYGHMETVLSRLVTANLHQTIRFW